MEMPIYECANGENASSGKKGRRYTIWGKHRIYEGYSGPVVLRNVPDGVKNIIQADAEKYGMIIE